MDVEATLAGGNMVDAYVRGFTVRTDQAKEKGGDRTAPSPFELFFVSIATCAAYYVLDFCRERHIPEEGAKVMLRTEIDEEKKMISKISIEIQLPPEFPAKYKKAVIRAVDLCSVKKHIENAPMFETYTSEAGS